MNRVTQVEVLSGLRLKVTFADGLTADINMEPYIGKGFTAELLVPERFAEVTTESGGGIAWPNGFDACPEFLRELAENKQAAA
ncbi:MAG: DUF2442 domain-containing protein [Flavobacteriales bacterium]|nr:DUF2442 domain-containing protein [Flavobacteriales bacterium]MCC6939708.1 DUF2442 domain-containing protein [Flavobacteriales bacterium]